MSKRLKVGLLTLLISALSTVVLGQSFTTFPQVRVINQLDLQGTLTTNGSTGTSGQFLKSNGAGDVTWANAVTSPGGADTQVQFNDGGVFAGDSALTWNKTTDRLTSGFITITGARTNADAPLLLSSTTTSVRWFETDAAADNGTWEWAANGEQFRLGALSDAGVLGGSSTALLIDRTGSTIDSITYNGVAFFTGSRMELENAAPLWQGDETDAPANERSWLTRQVAGDWFLSTATDASPQAAVNNAFGITRTGTTVDSITLTGTNIALTGNASTSGTHTFSQNGAHARFDGADPRWLFNETDQAVDAKNTLVRMVGGTFSISTATDAAPFSAVADNLTLTRAGVMNVSSNIQIGGVSVCRSNGTNCPTSGAANPSASVGLATVNGAATTYMRSDAAPPLDQSIAPTWTGAHTWSQNMALTKADPRFCTYDSGSDATWFWRMSADVLRLNIVDGSTCTTTGASAPFAITSAAGTVSAIGITSTALTWNGLDMVNTGSSPTWTGQHVFSNSSGAINLNSVNPALQWNESDQGVDGKLWNLIASSGSLQFQTRTDAGGAGAVPLSMTRSGTSVTSIGLAATTVAVTGNETVSGKSTVTNGVTATAGVNAGNRFSASTQAPTSLAADVNDWALTPAPIVLIAASAGGIDITGISASTANADAQSLGNNVILHLINTSSQRLTLQHESASSTAANRFSLPNSQAFGLAPGGSVSVYYDSVVSRWRTISAGIQTEVFSFTINWTNACTTTPTTLMSAAKFGNTVSMRINGNTSSCTGDVTSFTSSADNPAALIPDANACFSMGNNASDNGNAVSALFCIQSDGTFMIQECPLDGAAGFGCASSTWTASGTRFLGGLSLVFTYNLDQV